MTKDYKSKKQAVKKEKAPKKARSINLTALKWLSLGAVLGISVIFILPHLPMANLANQMKHLSLASASLKQKTNLAPTRDLTAQAQPPKQDTKPSFDFYTLLPEMKVEVPTKEEPVNTAAVTPPPKPKVSPSTPAMVSTPISKPVPPPMTTAHKSSKNDIVLQIASFKNFSDADAAKTQLLISGFPVRLQTITSSNGDTLHRIKMGPYKNKNFAERDRQRLVAMNYRQTVIVTEE